METKNTTGSKVARENFGVSVNYERDMKNPDVLLYREIGEKPQAVPFKMCVAAKSMKDELELEEAWLYSLRAMLDRAPKSVIEQITRRAEACRAAIEKANGGI